MKIIIVGDGKVGLAITMQLAKEGHDLIVIDSNREVLVESMEQYDVMVIHGNGASMPILKEAGAETADLLIAVTSTDEQNMLACIVAKHLGVKNTIARVRNPEYAEQLVTMREELGLSMPINPELAAATAIYNALQFPSFLHREPFAKGRVEIVELQVTENAKICNMPLHKLYKVLKLKVLVCVVERNGEAIIPNGDFILQADDRIHVTAEAKDLAKLVHAFGFKHLKIKSAMLIGGSRLAYYLARMLIASNVDVKIIENDPKRCNELAELLPEAMLIEGDGSKQRLLLEEGIESTDSFITLTDIDEENVFLSLYALHIGVKSVVTKVSRTEYADNIEQMGIKSVVCPKMICATEVVRYVRAMANRTGGAVITMHELMNGKVHALEFRATPNTKYLDIQLIDVPVKRNILLACIIRRGKSIIPQGSTCIKRGDNVIVVADSEVQLVDLNDIFEE